MLNFLLLIFLLVTHQSHAQNCNNIPPQLNSLLEPGNILLFGEYHGTNEMPQKFFDVICNGLTKNKKIKVGFEAPISLTANFQNYINSNDEQQHDAFHQLFMHDYWQGEFQDGRKSRAMQRLLANIRRLNQQSHNIEVFNFQPKLDKTEMAKADQHMASTFIESINDDTLIVALSGNAHTRNEHGTSWDSQYKIMGAFIKEKHQKMLSILFYTKTGHVWGCQSIDSCGSVKLGQSDPDVIELFRPAKKQNKHDWAWVIGDVSVSEPFKNTLK